MAAIRDDLRATTRWPALDGVRGLAVLAVVLYHAYRLTVLDVPAEERGIDVLAWPTGVARFALDSFFVLSGFLIIGSWRALRSRHELGPAAAEFARRRAARILPAYWVSLLVLVPLVAPHLISSPRELALLLGVQQYVQSGLPSEVNVVYWSLTTEVHFYVLAPAIAFLLARGFRRPLVVGTLVLAVVWQAGWLRGPLPQSFVFGRIDQFVIGAVAGELVRSWEAGRSSRLVRALQARGVGGALVAALVVLGTWQGAVIDGYSVGRTYALIHPLVGLVMAAGFVRILTADRPSLFDASWLRLLGLISYGIYLFHYPVLEYGLAWAGVSRSTPAAVTLPIVIGLTLASCVIGAVSYVVVERPFIRGPRRRAARRIPVAPERVPADRLLHLSGVVR